MRMLNAIKRYYKIFLYKIGFIKRHPDFKPELSYAQASLAKLERSCWFQLMKDVKFKDADEIEKNSA